MKKVIAILSLMSISLSAMAAEKSVSDFERGYQVGLKNSSGRVLVVEGYSTFPRDRVYNTRTQLELACGDGKLSQVICIRHKDIQVGMDESCAGLCVNDN